MATNKSISNYSPETTLSFPTSTLLDISGSKRDVAFAARSTGDAATRDLPHLDSRTWSLKDRADIRQSKSVFMGTVHWLIRRASRASCHGGVSPLDDRAEHPGQRTLAETGGRKQHNSMLPTAYNAHTTHSDVNRKTTTEKVSITCLSSQPCDDAPAL